jgi:serine/threonine protein phosphatase PrpC
MDNSVRPSDEELDLFGITHTGNVRAENQDHFLVATVHPQLVIHGTSLPNPDKLPVRGTRLATVLVVADGVGGAAAGSEASRVATEAVTRYVSSTLRSYHAAGSHTEEELLDALKAAALGAHSAVRDDAGRYPEQAGMATTLTVSIAIWPWAYVVQVGDSRAYYFDGTDLRQISHDQTVAQVLVDKGLMKRERLNMSPFKHMLASAIGADEALPEVTRFAIDTPDALIFLCSDGLTKHVTDEEIAESARTRTSSEQMARDLLELALSRGGSDNITIIAGAARRPDRVRPALA